MSLQITIPDAVLNSMRLPERQLEQELLRELAIALYAQQLLPFSRACELASMPRFEFSQLVGSRGISQRCGKIEIDGNFVYVCTE